MQKIKFNKEKLLLMNYFQTKSMLNNSAIPGRGFFKVLRVLKIFFIHLTLKLLSFNVKLCALILCQKN